MRGVYCARAVRVRPATGSSPHARGLLVQDVAVQLSLRIIPACAGFTGGDPATGAVTQDHPRMRGVYIELP